MRQWQTANISTLRPWYLRFVWHSNQQSRLKKGPRRNANTLKKESHWMFSTMNLVGSLDFACWHSCHVELPMVEATILGIAAWHTKTHENFESEPQETPIFSVFSNTWGWVDCRGFMPPARKLAKMISMPVKRTDQKGKRVDWVH